MRSSPCRTGSSGSRPAHSAAASAARETRRRAARRGARAGRCRIPLSKKTRIESRSGRTTQARFALIERRTSRLWRPAADVRADPLRERRAVEPVEAQRLGRRPARGPALDAEDRDRPAGERGAERVAEAADRRVVLEDEDVLERGDLAASQSASKRLSHGIATTRSDSSPLLRQQLGGARAPRAASPARTRRARRRSRRAARCRGRARARRRAARSDAATARSRAGSRRSPPRPRPPSGGARASPPAWPGWTIVTFGSAASSEMSRTLWCDLPGPAGMSPA